jgi:hypothetical protein
VHVTGDPAPYVHVGADRYWVGERASVSRFLAAAGDGTLAAWLDTAAFSKRKVGLVTPHSVDQARFEMVVAAIGGLSGRFDRVMTGDLGVASALRGVAKVYFCGRVHNIDHAMFLRDIGIKGVRAVCPVSTGAMDINREIDLEITVFGRIPLAFGPECLGAGQGGESRAKSVDGDEAVASGNRVSAGNVDSGDLVLTGRGGAVIVHPGWLQSAEFLDLSDSLRPFGRDTCGVIESDGLTPDEVAEAVDAIRFGRPVETTRTLFVSEQGIMVDTGPAVL